MNNGILRCAQNDWIPAPRLREDKLRGNDTSLSDLAALEEGDG
jgi:hypothetical protein